MHIHRSVIGVLLLLCSLPTASRAFAQTVEDERAWFTFTAQSKGTATSPWRWTLDALIRSRNGVKEVDVVALRPYISYVLSKRSTISGGYAISPTFPVTGGVTVEQRAFGQFTFTSPTMGGTFSSRSRVEARFIDGNSGPLGRLRELVRFSRPVRSGSRFSLIGYDEFLVHVNNTTRSPRGVDQNRAFVGIGDAVTSSARFEIGYLNQFSPGHRGAEDRMNHVLSGTFVLVF